jgi:hypothetical protein
LPDLKKVIEPDRQIIFYLIDFSNKKTDPGFTGLLYGLSIIEAYMVYLSSGLRGISWGLLRVRTG